MPTIEIIVISIMKIRILYERIVSIIFKKYIKGLAFWKIKFYRWYFYEFDWKHKHWLFKHWKVKERAIRWKSSPPWTECYSTESRAANQSHIVSRELISNLQYLQQPITDFVKSDTRNWYVSTTIYHFERTLQKIEMFYKL